uniref:Reverse transcriptase domain-containing protein n=1 Tax=Tanacetum cinerariifolium TaxID=118510 RepID=A0A699IG27_TANCI|nr:reverse transcriptase domain-containing protein [Tanacetum cinerariifolium]
MSEEFTNYSTGGTLSNAYVVSHVQFYLNKDCENPVEIHNIKQRDGETIEDFIERFKVETGRMKGAPECMRISRFMHGVNNPELTKCLNEHVLNTMEEMMTATTAFIRGATAAASKKRPHIDGGLTGLPLTITPKEILTAEARKFKPPPSMVTPIEKRSSNKFCDFHNDKGHSTDEYVQLKKQIKKLWHRMTRQKVTQSFAHVREITFSPLATNRGTEGPLVIEAEIDGHMIHRMYVDGGSSMEEVTIEGTLSMKGRTGLCSILKENLDIIAWQLSDMTGVLRLVAKHRLNIQEGYTLVRQKKRPAPECARAIQVKLEDVCGFHGFKQGLFAGLLPLLEIDWKVESLCSYPFKCFLDAYKGNHQIQMSELDEEKTDFHTSHGVYCYTKMPFGLKNAGATYQRLVDKAFDSQVGRNIEVYVDDLVIKSHTETEMLRDIDETFPPKPKEELIVYLSASHGAISAVPMTERDTVQTPVYFVSRALQVPELNYIPMEKLVLALVFISKRLRRYFQAHPIAVITDQPIKQIMSRPDVAGRLQKWSIMLGEHNIRYQPRTSVKGQILADFLVEKPDEAPPDTSVANTPQESRTLFTDGSSCVDGSGVGIILTSPNGMEFTYALRFQFTASNNEAEYEALIAGLRIATQMVVCNVHWIEAKVMATITDSQVKKFVWDNIVCRFGLPGEIVSDNGKQFSDNPFKDWSLGKGIKACLGEGNKNWIKELPHVLWSHHTMIKSSHDDTPFSLTYRTEAVIPTEIKMSTYRTAVVNVVHNNEELRLNLDLLEERRERVAIREVKAKLKMTKYYNARVRGVTFRPGDFVYCSNDASHAVDRESLAQSGKDFMRSRKHLETEPTG